MAAVNTWAKVQLNNELYVPWLLDKSPGIW
jgi:hypothetical protein